MRPSCFYHLLLVFALLLPASGRTEEFLTHHGSDTLRGSGSRKTVLVVEFGAPSPSGSKLGGAIQQARKEFAPLEPLSLPDERMLEQLLESKSDGSIGMVILIHPRNLDLIGRLPGLYPDISFTIIDTQQPNFSANVQSVRFKEEDGIFLLGAISAIRSEDRIAVMAMDENARSKQMADGFVAGVKHIHPAAPITVLMNIRPSTAQRTRLSTVVTSSFQEGTGIIFSMDDEIIEQGLRAAKPERKMVVSANPPPPGSDTTRLLTYLVKRYDLALLDVLRIYQHNQWHAGTIELGLSGGYVDYSLNADNVDVFPKDAIDQIEAIKDYLGQGMVK